MFTLTMRDGTRAETSRMPDTTPIVYVVDDDESVRESLELLIESSGWRAETFASALEFLACHRARVPGCLVLDAALPDLSGLELQRRVAAERPDLSVVFLSGRADVRIIVQAMKAGAVEFLSKPVSDDAVFGVLQHALERSRRALEREAKLSDLRESCGTLTPREREVMVLVATGLLNKQVGGELGISEITVKAHRGQVMRKMGAASLADLVTIAARLEIRHA